MEISIHPIQMIKAIRYKRKQKKSNTYPYSRNRVSNAEVKEKEKPLQQLI